MEWKLAIDHIRFLRMPQREDGRVAENSKANVDGSRGREVGSGTDESLACSSMATISEKGIRRGNSPNCHILALHTKQVTHSSRISFRENLTEFQNRPPFKSWSFGENFADGILPYMMSRN